MPAGVLAAETGVIVGWGNQVVVPDSELKGLVAVAAGNYHSLGLKSDGSTAENPAIRRAKALADGAFVCAHGAAVSAAWSDVFYIEADNRNCGLRVEKSVHSLAAGKRANVAGIVRTNADGERYLEASYAFQTPVSAAVKPLGMLNRALGGAGFGMQQGVAGGVGLNNIGLLVRTCGKVTRIGPDYLYIDDGSHLKDGTRTGAHKNIGVRVICDPAGYRAGDYIIVTGISSCFKTPSGSIVGRVLTRTGSDIVKLPR